MRKVTIQLTENFYQRLQKTAKQAGKSVQTLIYEWIEKMSENDGTNDITQDPVYLMEGYDSDAPDDLSKNLDRYLYGDQHPK